MDLSQPKILQSPAAAAAAASVTAAFALSKAEKLESNSNGVVSKNDINIEIEAVKEEKNVLELSLTEVRAENSKLKGAIEEVNGTHAELGKVSISDQVLARGKSY